VLGYVQLPNKQKTTLAAAVAEQERMTLISKRILSESLTAIFLTPRGTD